MDLALSMGGKPIYSTTLDFCTEVLPIGSLVCPIPSGSLSLPLSMDIPTLAPPGTYVVGVSLKDQDGQEDFCIDLEIELVKSF